MNEKYVVLGLTVLIILGLFLTRKQSEEDPQPQGNQQPRTLRKMVEDALKKLQERNAWFYITVYLLIMAILKWLYPSIFDWWWNHPEIFILSQLVFMWIGFFSSKIFTLNADDKKVEKVMAWLTAGLLVFGILNVIFFETFSKWIADFSQPETPAEVSPTPVPVAETPKGTPPKITAKKDKQKQKPATPPVPLEKPEKAPPKITAKKTETQTTPNESNVPPSKEGILLPPKITKKY